MQPATGCGGDRVQPREQGGVRDLRPVGDRVGAALAHQHGLQEPAVRQPHVPQVAAVDVVLAAVLVGTA